MKKLTARLRSFWRGLRRPDRVEAEMDEEMRFHLDLRTEDLMRAGLSPAEAARRARVEFGSAERYKEEGRRARGLGWTTGWWLDAKLGARMVARYPGVTVVGGLALTIGIGLGAAFLEGTNDFLRPSLPLPDGDRIVGLENWDVAENDPALRSMHDFAVWRDELRTVEELGAFRSVEANLYVPGGSAEPAPGAEITPSAFRLARVPALLGRTLVEADAREGAPPVIVIGHDLWRSRFFGDAGIIGRTVRLGGEASTVVGVMPEGFGFPLSHEFWVPLRADAGAYGPGEGPAIRIFGRLAPGATLDEARVELATLGRRAAADHPATHERLRPRVVRYTELYVGGETGWQAYLTQSLFVLLLLILGSNVATMVFARAAARENEIAMRFALGASRGRILAQFFLEALVLALGSTAVALAIVAWGADWLARFVWQVTEGRTPFWLDERLNASTVLYALGLALLGSLVAGVLPALKATGAGTRSRLRHSPGAAGSGLRFGGVWSGMIVVQVAFAVMVVPPALVAVSALAEPGYVEPGFAGEEYLSAQLRLDAERPPADSAEAAAFYAGFEATVRELERRLLADPRVEAVTFATRLPVMNHPQPWAEVEGAERIAGAPAAHWVMATAVDLDFFETFGAEVVAGRTFDSGDLRADARVVVVNEHFVREMLQGRNAVGRRIRYTNRYGERAAAGRPREGERSFMREPGEWYTIVGVVGGLGMDTNRDPFYSGSGPGVYHPLAREAMGSGGSYAVRLALHARGEAAPLAPELRALAHALDPALRLSDVLPLDRPVDRANRNERVISRFFSWTTALVALIALLISIAGIYSLMAFTVSRQTREIGIRIALGADRRRILTGVFSRAIVQIGAGILVGFLVWLGLFTAMGEFDEAGLLAVTAVVMMVVGLLACGVPVRRALRIEPTEALRDVG